MIIIIPPLNVWCSITADVTDNEFFLIKCLFKFTLFYENGIYFLLFSLDQDLVLYSYSN